MDPDSFNFDNAWQFVYPGKRHVKSRPAVLGDVQENSDGWYYGMQTFPEGTRETYNERIVEGPFANRDTALNELYSDTLDWFSGEGYDQSKVPIPKSFTRALSGDDSSREDDEDEVVD